jgi:endonuclease/exonuclease/phosphatase family metal-dependent hydrolase
MVRIIIILFLFFSIPALAQDLKILSLNFNSETAHLDHSGELREKRLCALVDYVHAENPDVILLQEGWNLRKDSSVAATLAREIGYDVSYRVVMGLPFYFFDSDAVLAKKELHMSGERDVKLPHSSIQIGDGKNWIIVFGRISYAIGVKLELADGYPLYVYDTHLIAETEADKKDELAAIHHEIEAQASGDHVPLAQIRAIVGGDLNSGYASPAIALMKTQGYEDALTVSHPDFHGCSFCGDPTDEHFDPFTIAPNQTPAQTDRVNERDDWIFVKSPHHKILGTSFVFDEPYQGVWMSDHFGVQTRIAFDDPDAQATQDPLYSSATPSPRATLMSIDEAQLNTGTLALNSLTVRGPRGFVLANDSKRDVSIVISGPGEISTAPSTRLHPGGASSFIFSQPGRYHFVLGYRGSVHGIDGELIVE